MSVSVVTAYPNEKSLGFSHYFFSFFFQSLKLIPIQKIALFTEKDPSNSRLIQLLDILSVGTNCCHSTQKNWAYFHVGELHSVATGFG